MKHNHQRKGSYHLKYLLALASGEPADKEVTCVRKVHYFSCGSQSLIRRIHGHYLGSASKNGTQGLQRGRQIGLVLLYLLGGCELNQFGHLWGNEYKKVCFDELYNLLGLWADFGFKKVVNYRCTPLKVE